MPKNIGVLIYVGCFFSLLFLQAFAYAMLIHIDHDEHQYLASGYLLAKEGLLPYLDYPYFQLPNITFLYAILAIVTDHLLFGARILAAFFGWGIGIIAYRIILHLFDNQQLWQKHLVATILIVLLFLNPLYNYAAWKAWTHSLPLLLTLLAYWKIIKHWNQPNFQRAAFWSGLLLSVALGTRISYAFFIPVFLVSIVLHPSAKEFAKCLKLLSRFTIGGVIGGLPSIIFWIIAPRQFWFDVVQYHTQIDTAYFEELKYDRSFNDLWHHFLDLIQQGGNVYYLWLLGIGFMAFLLFSIAKKQNPSFGFYFTLLLIPCALAGAFSKVITFPQYYFTAVPFVLLALAWAIRSFPIQWSIGVLILVALFFNIKLQETWKFHHLSPAVHWKSLDVYQESLMLKPFIKDKQVLTLSPLYVLEGGGHIYPAFATGPFAWRTSHLVDVEKREQIKMIGEKELENYLKPNFPDAVLTGFEGRHDDKIKAFAKENNFIPFRYQYEKKHELWLPKENLKTAIIAQKLDTTFEQLNAAYSQSIHDNIGNLFNPISTLGLRAKIAIQVEPEVKNQALHLVLEIRRNGTSIFWQGEALDTKNLKIDSWNYLESPIYLSQGKELKEEDELILFLWNPKEVPLQLKNLQLEKITIN